MTIHILDPHLVNQIAAGEVIERPASVVKELVENAIDANATEIKVTIQEGGKSLIQVTDNGQGMTKDDLMLCVERHATSKLTDQTLFSIQTLGFRGEALPSIGSISKLKITTRFKDDNTPTGWSICVHGGEKLKIQPETRPIGTSIEIRDLFYATPARLKFLKSNATEAGYIADWLEKLALAYPHISFQLIHGEKEIFSYSCASSLDDRISQILGTEFLENSCYLDKNIASSPDFLNLTVKGWCSLPTYSKGQNTQQYFFINGRFVKDKFLQTAVKVAYNDLLFLQRHPVLCLFITMDPSEVDVNVHPAKTEVRFRNSHALKGVIIDSLRQALRGRSVDVSTTTTSATLQRFSGTKSSPSSYTSSAFQNKNPIAYASAPLNVSPHEDFSFHWNNNDDSKSKEEDFPLGTSIAQLFETFVLAKTGDSLLLVDQHAAHERIIYEQGKRATFDNPVPSQALLLPEIIDMPPATRDVLFEHQETLKILGLEIEAFGINQVLVRSLPYFLNNENIKTFLDDITQECLTHEDTQMLKQHLCEKLATHACHHSIRSGKKMSNIEMDALLRQMEATDFSAQCNHGRPTYIKLTKSEIETLFHRK